MLKVLAEGFFFFFFTPSKGLCTEEIRSENTLPIIIVFNSRDFACRSHFLFELLPGDRFFSSSFYFPLLFCLISASLLFYLISLLNHFWKSKTSCLRAVLGFDSWNQSSPGSKVLFLFLFQSISKCKRRTILKLIKGKQVLCFFKDYFNSFFCQKILIQLLLVHFICDLKLCICYWICRSHLSCIIIFLNILF